MNSTSTSTSNSSSVTSSLLDGRPDKDTAGPILIQGFLQYLCQGTLCNAFGTKHGRLITVALQGSSSRRSVGGCTVTFSVLIRGAAQSAKFYHRWQDDPVALRVYVVVLLFCSL